MFAGGLESAMLAGAGSSWDSVVWSVPLAGVGHSVCRDVVSIIYLVEVSVQILHPTALTMPDWASERQSGIPT